MLLNIKNKKFKVNVVISEKQTQKGMMGRKFDENFDGMLFIMSDEQNCFWMKNCITNLDIIFIKNDIITKIHSNCPPCFGNECENYCGIGNIILEIQGGTCIKNNIKEGDKLEY